MLVDDPMRRGFTDPRLHIPGLPAEDWPSTALRPIEQRGHVFPSTTDRRENHVYVDEQIHAGFTLMVSAADHEVDVLSLNGEIRRGEFPGRFIASEIGVHQTASPVPNDPVFGRGSVGLGRRGSERRAFHRPFPGGIGLKIRDQKSLPAAG
jgi:hypothetical protein